MDENNKMYGFILFILVIMLVLHSSPAQDTGRGEGNHTLVEEEVRAILDCALPFETIPSPADPGEEIAQLEGYTSPAASVIAKMKEHNFSNETISSILEEYGYGWDPRTGACWKGRPPGPEEQEYINIIRGPNYTPFPESKPGTSVSAG